MGKEFCDIMEGLTSHWLAAQKIKDCDTYDDNGILICGICGEPRQEFKEWSKPTEEDPHNKVALKTPRMCKCDRDRKEEEENEKKRQEDLDRISYLRKASLMDTKFKDATFDRFQETNFNRKNLKFCKRYATAFDEMLKKNQGLLLWGGVGTGKTYSAACVANHLLQNKVPVVMTSFVKILELIQGDKDEEMNIMRKLTSAKLVILDDLGAERNTSYALEKVYNIVDSRYRSGFPMILTTNLTLNEMQEETDNPYARIYDRIFEVCYPMQFTGDSFRRQAAFEKYNEIGKFLEGED